MWKYANCSMEEYIERFHPDSPTRYTIDDTDPKYIKFHHLYY